MLLVVGTAPARAQDSYHWPRQHAAPPLSEILPEALSPPPSPVEKGNDAERPKRDLVHNTDGTFTYEERTFTARVDGEGRVAFNDKPSIQAHVLISPLFIAAYGTFDATDILMRWLGEDPYQYQKAKFLERTFEERARMRKRHTRRTMERALHELPDYLADVWRYEEWSIDLRKRVLFALWDECAEDGNPLMVRGGAEARAIIEGFVRAHLGPDSPHAFRADELVRLNALRTSQARFAPYPGAEPAAAPAMIAVSP
jgi:hypothetical protein